MATKANKTWAELPVAIALLATLKPDASAIDILCALFHSTPEYINAGVKTHRARIAEALKAKRAAEDAVIAQAEKDSKPADSKPAKSA